MTEKIKVLVVDDSALVRKVITDILESDPGIEVVGSANNGKTAIYKNTKLNPDVITMDIEMPIMDGLAALQYIVETNPKPVIMMSVLTQHGAEATFKALEYGAVDFIPKPSSLVSMSVDEIAVLLIEKVKSVSKSKVSIVENLDSKNKVAKSNKTTGAVEQAPVKAISSKIVGIGTSTGGPSALINILSSFPENFPSPVLIVQHMPEGFTKAFSERLDGSSTLKVKEAEDGDVLLPGHGYLAPGHSHMEVLKKGSGYFLRVFKGDKVSGHMPSIDVLFQSMANTIAKNSVAVIMTGMGRDGANGIGSIKENGGHTIAQDKNTSVVYGMNRVAVESGAIHEVVSLFNISKKVVEQI